MGGFQLDILIRLLSGFVGSTLTSSSGIWTHHRSSCVYEDHLITDRNWFGYLANITIVASARLTFEFYYPADKCCQNILFYSEDQMSIINGRMNCWQKEYLLRPEEDQILRLTPRFSWSGCHMTHPNDIAMYVCKGGRSLTVEPADDRPQSWYIAVSNCATLQGLDLRYRMEVFGHVGECRSISTYYGEERHGTVLPSIYEKIGGVFVLPSARAAIMARESEGEGEGGPATTTETTEVCVIEGDVNTTQVWFGFIANISLLAGGGFYFRLSYPYAMQIQNVILYNEDDLHKLTPDKSCWQKDGIIRSHLVPDQVLDLNYRASWNGCASKNYSHGRNLTCQGERRYDKPRKIHLAVSNCRSTVGLQLHYRFEVFGYEDDEICSGAMTSVFYHRPRLLFFSFNIDSRCVIYGAVQAVMFALKQRLI